MPCPPAYPSEFGARVYKIGRDAQGNRLTYLKVTGGCLRVRAPLSYCLPSGERLEEKVNQSSASIPAPNIETGGRRPLPVAVCAVTGPLANPPGPGPGGRSRRPVARFWSRCWPTGFVLPEGCDPAPAAA